MDYQKHYNLLIEKAQQRTTDLYTERHHIVPRCLGGTDDQDNLVALTPEEHYVAHQLLVKMHPDNQKLIYAAMMMIPKSWKNQQRSNKIYGWLKRKYLNICKQRVGAKNGSFGKRWYHDPVTLESGKFREEEVPDGWEIGRVPLPNCKYCGTKTKTKNSHCCDSCKKTISFKREKGKIVASEERKKNIAKARKRRVWIFNPVLEKVTNIDKDEPLPEGWYYGKKIRDPKELNLPEKTKEQKEKERREKISKYNKGRPKSKEHREKLREAALRKSDRE